MSTLHRNNSSGIGGGGEKKLSEAVIKREFFLMVSEPKTTFVAADNTWARQSQTGILGTAVIFYFNPACKGAASFPTSTSTNSLNSNEVILTKYI